MPNLEDAEKLNQKITELFNSEKYTEAIPYAEKILSIHEVLGSKSETICDFLITLAKLYFRTGEKEKAQSLCKRCVAITESKDFLEIELGNAVLEKETAEKLSQGSVLALNKHIGESLEIRLNSGHFYGYGKIDNANDGIGVCITELAGFDLMDFYGVSREKISSDGLDRLLDVLTTGKRDLGIEAKLDVIYKNKSENESDQHKDNEKVRQVHVKVNLIEKTISLNTLFSYKVGDIIKFPANKDQSVRVYIGGFEIFKAYKTVLNGKHAIEIKELPSKVKG